MSSRLTISGGARAKGILSLQLEGAVRCAPDVC
jgi:hypothetical protein